MDAFGFFYFALYSRDIGWRARDFLSRLSTSGELLE